MEPISVFGKRAELIGEGDVFTAKVRYVEGRKVVDLVSVRAGNTRDNKNLEGGDMRE